MKKELMLLGLCMMGAFSALQADEPETKSTEIAQEETPVATPTTTETTVPVDEKDKGCGCGKR